MQTFLPYKSFSRSARCLDNKRLGKQRVEAMQILTILLGQYTKPGWRNHPAVLQWKDHEHALFLYLIECCEEWKRRGFRNDKLQLFIDATYRDQHACSGPLASAVVYPPWLGKKAFHDSHKSRLLQKEPAFYAQFNWNVPLDLEYVWPVRKENPARRIAPSTASSRNSRPARLLDNPPQKRQSQRNDQQRSRNKRKSDAKAVRMR